MENKGVREVSAIKYQTEQIIIPSSTPVGIQSRRIKLDSSMTKCVGVAVYVLNGAGAGVNWRLGLKDDDTVFQHPTAIDDWVCSTAVPQKERYKKFDIPARGNEAEIQFVFLNATTQQLIVDVVFLLERIENAPSPRKGK